MKQIDYDMMALQIIENCLAIGESDLTRDIQNKCGMKFRTIRWRIWDIETRYQDKVGKLSNKGRAIFIWKPSLK